MISEVSRKLYEKMTTFMKGLADTGEITGGGFFMLENSDNSLTVSRPFINVTPQNFAESMMNSLKISHGDTYAGMVARECMFIAKNNEKLLNEQINEGFPAVKQTGIIH